MAHRLAGTLRFQVRSLQLEIPTRLAVRVVDQHHAVAVFQPERLLLDYLGVLADKSRAEHIE